MLIFETENFILESVDKPFVSRNEGGHIRLKIKDESITDRTKLSPHVAVEYMRFSIIAGQALEEVMTKQGIPVVKINYQDMGNWAAKKNEQPILHMHIFGRSKNAIIQKFPESVYLPARESGFYDTFAALNENDVGLLKNRIEQLSQTTKFLNENWKISSS
jgi:diadenosine tetraphosphate (Ap4A) HIT family hydrolase